MSECAVHLKHIEHIPTQGGLTISLWKCSCGQEVRIPNSFVKTGKIKSCGHLKYPNGDFPVRLTSEYRAWRDMKQRCHNPKNHAYKYYGARGIVVAEVWKSDFKQFFLDVGKRPDGFTLERIDNDKGYEPGNVKWVSWSDNLKNRRSWKWAQRKQ